MNQAILTGVIGLVTGGIGSLIAPWVSWGIEKKKLRYNKRIELLNELKSFVMNETYDRISFVNTPNYLIIREYLSEKLVKELEQPKNHMTIGNTLSPFNRQRNIVLEELSQISKKWKLV